MKCPIVLLLWLALTSVAPAQIAATTTTSAGSEHEAPLRVVSQSWSKVRPSRLSLETGMPQAASGPGERLSEVSLQNQVAAQRKHGSPESESVRKLEERQIRQQRRLPETGTGRTTSARQSVRGGGYRYAVVLQNPTPKKVRAVEWDYVFVDPATSKELRRHRLTSRAGIEPGKQKKLTAESGEAPYGVVEVKGLSGEKTGERVEIIRVEFADGTVWEK